MVHIGGGTRIRSPGIYPKNVGQSVVAQNRLDRIVDAESRKISEALQVDGTVLRVWQPLRSGTVCTCKNAPENRPVSLKGQEQYLDTADSASKVIFKVRSIDPQRDNNKPPTPTNSPIDSIEDNLYDSFEPTDGEDDQEFIEKIMRHDDDTINSLIDENAYIISSKNTCAICFGTGYVGGYTLWGGLRHILDNSGQTTLTMTNGGYVRTTARPNEFILKAGKNIIFKSVLPPYFSLLAGPFVRNNKQCVNNVTVSYAIDGINWYSNIQALPPPTSDYVYFLVSNTGKTDAIFTHVEHYLAYQESLRGQIENLQLQSGNDYFKATASTNLVLSANIGTIDRNSYVCDSKYGFMWKVNSTRTIQTAKNQITSTECEAQLVRPVEPIELLNFERKTIIEAKYSGVNSPLTHNGPAEIGAYSGLLYQQLLDLLSLDQAINNYYLPIPEQFVITNNEAWTPSSFNFWVNGGNSEDNFAGDTIRGSLNNQTNNTVLNLTTNDYLTVTMPNVIMVNIPETIIATLSPGLYNFYLFKNSTTILSAILNIENA